MFFNISSTFSKPPLLKLFDENSISVSITDAILSVPELQDSEVRSDFIFKFLANKDNFLLSVQSIIFDISMAFLHCSKTL